MTASDAEADVFAVPSFHRTSQWLDHLDSQSSPFFFSTELSDSKREKSRFCNLAPTDVEEDGFFKLPAAVGEKSDEGVTEGPEPSYPTVDDTISSNHDPSDLWTDLESHPNPQRLYRTWADFQSQNHAAHQPAFVSEAGPAVYDALLGEPRDPLGLAETHVPVVKTEAYFSSLLALALGYESALFAKDTQAGRFKPVLPTMRISGYSRGVLQHVEKQCLVSGATILALRAFLQAMYASRTARCGVALASSIGEVLQSIQEHLATENQKPQSLLRLQAIVRGIMLVLGPFRALTSRLRGDVPDEELVMLVFEQASSADFNNNDCPEVMREVLQRVSRPWIEFMEEWIGTRREEGIPLAKTNEGQCKGFVKVGAQVHIDDFGQEVEELDFRLEEDKIPRFLPDELAEVIFETGRNLRFIRSHHPTNALAHWGVIESAQPPKACWLFNWEQISQLESRVASYHDNLVDAIKQYRNDAKVPRGSARTLSTPGVHKSLGFFGIETEQIEEQLMASMQTLDQPVQHVTKQDSLQHMVHRRLQLVHEEEAAYTAPTPRWSLLPILSFGGIVTAQARAVNRESLRLLFEKHDLRKHLGLQRDYQMLGNGNFCSRLCQALFDPDMETAERQHGVVRTGAVMGLRLGGRDTWPPASSELRLALMGVLAEAHKLQAGGDSEEHKAGSSSDLLGDLSFAVRDLTPEEIDQCMDPDSLEALDFLRLSYKTPSALSFVITPVNLMHYDRIFKQLLRLQRMLHVVNQLFRDVAGRRADGVNSDDISRLFAYEAHHFVCTISAYFMDTGVAIPWRRFEQRLAEVELDLAKTKSDAALGGLDSPSRLQDYHSYVIDQIMQALFLKKRQQPFLKLLDEVLRVVLLFAKQTKLRALGKDRDVGGTSQLYQLHKDFEKRVQLFTTVCRGLTEKGQSSKHRKKLAEDWIVEEGMGEESKISQLLVKLDMAGYYSKR